MDVMGRLQLRGKRRKMEEPGGYMSAESVEESGEVDGGPGEVKIGPITFELRAAKGLVNADGRDMDGVLDCCECVIIIRDNMNPQRTYFTLWHEIVHAIMAYSGHEVNDGVCDAVATGVMGALKDNEWIREVPK